ncbi:MAG: hypothetical protein N3I86_14505 [Verrucomicrobiae bacterium]|nr:hypothetical protein [Verrucomicrobiae bacterium]
MWFKPTSAQAWVEIPFTVEQEITGEFWLKMLHSWDYGTYRVKLDDRELGTFDLWNADIQPRSHKLGPQTLSPGPHTLRFECTGKSDRSRGFFLGFDALMVRTPVYTRPPGFDLRKIQVNR